MGFASSRVNLILVIVFIFAALLAGCNRSATKPEPTTEPAVEEESQETPVQIMATPTLQVMPEAPTGKPTEEVVPSVEPAEPTAVVPQPEPSAVPTEASAPVEATEPAAEQSYVVTAGDTLFAIAEYFGVSVEELAARNGITDINVLEVGQQLVIPVAGAAPPAAPVTGEQIYIVQSGDNLFRIALRYDLSFETVAAYNNIPWPYAVYVGQEIRIPPVP
jgi:LysM repeat protein